MIKNWPRRIPLPENLIGRIPSLGDRVPRELYEFHVIDDNLKGVADEFRYAKPSGRFAVPFDDTGFEDLQDELFDSEEVNE
uniref:Uncharacterized protein n=1 Tax=viral metagenome TaxID=1070528 RepID=A0A6M3LWA0_9ZZZZ